MAETERIDQPKQASQDEAPRMDCPTCHVSHVGPTAEALRSRLSSVERDERVERMGSEWERRAREYRAEVAELGYLAPTEKATLVGRAQAYESSAEELRLALNAARIQGAVPSPDGGDLPAPRVERHPDWEGGWVLHFKTYSVAVAQLEREQRRDAAYAEAARDPAFCADMKALTHGVGALPAPRECNKRFVGIGPTCAPCPLPAGHGGPCAFQPLSEAGASRSGGGSAPEQPKCIVCRGSGKISADGNWPWPNWLSCGECNGTGVGGTPPLEGSRE